MSLRRQPSRVTSKPIIPSSSSSSIF
ncbi:unnamed protein product, partial [Adineta steineri]